MIGFIVLTREEKEILLSHFRKLNYRTSRERAHAILLNSNGKTAYEIGKTIFRSERTIISWIKSFHKARISSIFPKTLENQNAAKLTREQKQEITEVLNKPPSDFGIPAKFWEVKTLRSYIKAEFGVEYESPESYRLVFKILNWSYHLPDKFDVKRDEKLIEKRIREIREEIEPMLKDNSWVVLASDETRLELEAIVRKLWLPKGKKSILKVRRDKTYQSFIGFLDLKNGHQHLIEIPWQNQDEIIKASIQIKNEYKKLTGNKNIKLCFIWDNASFHKGKKIREALRLKRKMKGIYLINFPPYAPDTNPQEHVWKKGKDQISNQQFTNMFELKKTFKQIITGQTYPYQI